MAQPFAMALLLAIGLCSLAHSAELRLFQWNPHWECFAHQDCSVNVVAELNDLFQTQDLDFANVLEFISYTPPTGLTLLTANCGRERTTLFYNATRWRRSPMHMSKDTGCTEDGDRPFIVEVFEQHCCETKVPRLIVVGAHFSHNLRFSKLRDAVAAAMRETETYDVAIIADTDVPISHRTRDIMEAMAVPRAAEYVHTDLENTCCLDTGFEFAYDRISTNFGQGFTTQILFDPTPRWVEPGTAFHKAVLGVLDLGIPSDRPGPGPSPGPSPGPNPHPSPSPSPQQQDVETHGLRNFFLCVLVLLGLIAAFLIGHRQRRDIRMASLAPLGGTSRQSVEVADFRSRGDASSAWTQFGG